MKNTKAKVLITNIIGYVGQNLCKKIKAKNYDLYGIVPVGTDPMKYEEFRDIITVIEITINDIINLRNHLEENYYDFIIHVQDDPTDKYFKKKRFINNSVNIVEQIVEYCMKNDSVLIHLSNTDVFETAPVELPAYFRKKNNYKSKYAKVLAEEEAIIEKNRIKGLKAIILRHSVWYGEGCKGFSKNMISAIKLRLFPLVNERIYIHLTNILLFCEIIEQAITNTQAIGKNYNVTDHEPVVLSELTHFINQLLKEKKYGAYHSMNLYFGRNIAELLSKLRLYRCSKFFEQITHNWFYDSTNLKRDFNPPRYNTIPAIAIAVTGEQMNFWKDNEQD